MLKNAITLMALGLAWALPPLVPASEPEHGLSWELEAGALWQSRNEVQIPNTSEGTRFSLRDAAGSGPWPAGRLYVTWHWNERNALRLLLAPFSATETGTLPGATNFAGAAFAPGTPTEATYKFNSWRLTYSNRVYQNPRWTWRIGFTAKIRDAKIELRQEGVASKKTDVGFVPLLHLRGTYRIAEHWRVILDADALAGGPGRAEDASLKLERALGDGWRVSLGYRTLEGGADVDEVYNFAWLHYAVASISGRF